MENFSANTTLQEIIDFVKNSNMNLDGIDKKFILYSGEMGTVKPNGTPEKISNYISSMRDTHFDIGQTSLGEFLLKFTSSKEENKNIRETMKEIIKKEYLNKGISEISEQLIDDTFKYIFENNPNPPNHSGFKKAFNENIKDLKLWDIASRKFVENLPNGANIDILVGSHVRSPNGEIHVDAKNLNSSVLMRVEIPALFNLSDDKNIKINGNSLSSYKNGINSLNDFKFKVYLDSSELIQLSVFGEGNEKIFSPKTYTKLSSSGKEYVKKYKEALLALSSGVNISDEEKKFIRDVSSGNILDKNDAIQELSKFNKMAGELTNGLSNYFGIQVENLNRVLKSFGSNTPIIGPFISRNFMEMEAKELEAQGKQEEADDLRASFPFAELGGEILGTLGPRFAVAFLSLASAGAITLSTPMVIGLSIVGSIFGEDFGKTFYQLLKDTDNNGRMDLIDRMSAIIIGQKLPDKKVPEIFLNKAIDFKTDIKIAELVELAKSDIAYRYALRELNPFVAVGADYTEFNQDGSLNLLDENNQNGMSDAYIEDRSKMLILQLLYFKNGKKLNRDLSSDDLNIDWSKIGDFDYIDYSILPFAGGSKDPFVLSVDGEGLIYDNQIIAFASNEGGKIKGSNKADRMYGKSGADEFDGGKGNDYFEGGTGFDTYHIEGHDIVFDIDGLGLLYKNNGEETITDIFDIFSEDIWKTKDQKQTAFKKGNNLEIIEDDDENTKVTIYNFFNTAKEMGNYWHSLGIHIEKPKEKPLLDYEFPEHDMQVGASNKNNTFYGSGEYVWYRGGDKTDQVISSFKEGMIAELGHGSDMFLGNIKKDIVWGDNGKDVLIGSNRNEENIDDPDYIEGGEDKDLINGGSGNDVLYGDNPDLISYTKTNPAISYDFSDWIVGGFGDDKMFGSAGKDILVGGGHKDIIFGGAGADLILGDAQLLFDYKHIIPAIVSNIPVTNEFTFDPKTKTWFADKSKGFYHFKIKEESFDWSFDIKYNEEKTDYEIISEYKLKEEIFIDEKGETDYLYGGEGDDLMLGQKGNDFMFGEDGDDIMFGDDNRDLSISGNDYMVGGLGNNKLYGGKGNDTYIIDYNSNFYNSNSNFIYDSEGNDTIDLSGFNFFDLNFYSDNQGNLGVIKNYEPNGYLVHIKNFISNPIENWIFKDGRKSNHEIQKYSYKDNYIPPVPPIDIDYV